MCGWVVTEGHGQAVKRVLTMGVKGPGDGEHYTERRH